MVHCGYEPTAVSQTFGSLRGLAAAARLTLLGPSRDSDPSSDDPISIAPAPVLYQLHKPESARRREPVAESLEARAG